MSGSAANVSQRRRWETRWHLGWLVPALVLAVPLGAQAQFTEFEATLARFDADVSAGVAEDAGGAVSVAVFDGADVIWTKGWGWADIENRVAAAVLGAGPLCGRLGHSLDRRTGIE